MTRDEWLNLALARSEALVVAESAVAVGVLECSGTMHAALAGLACSLACDLAVAA